jgi:hypothetical protein
MGLDVLCRIYTNLMRIMLYLWKVISWHEFKNYVVVEIGLLGVRTFTKNLFPLPPWHPSAASAVQTKRWMVQKFPAKRLQQCALCGLHCTSRQIVCLVADVTPGMSPIP